MALSDVKVRSAKPEAKAWKLTDGDGMVLLVHPNGSKYWRLRYRFGGKEKMRTPHLVPLSRQAQAILENYYLPANYNSAFQFPKYRFNFSIVWRHFGVVGLQTVF